MDTSYIDKSINCSRIASNLDLIITLCPAGFYTVKFQDSIILKTKNIDSLCAFLIGAKWGSGLDLIDG